MPVSQFVPRPPRPPKRRVNVRNSLPMLWVRQNGANLLREIVMAPDGKPHFVRTLALTDYLFYHAQRATFARVSTSHLRRTDIFDIPAIDALLREAGATIAFIDEDFSLNDRVRPVIEGLYAPVFGSYALPFLHIPSFDFPNFTKYCGPHLGSAWAPSAEAAEHIMFRPRHGSPPHHFPLDTDGVIIYKIFTRSPVTSVAWQRGITNIALVDVHAIRHVLGCIFGQTLPPPAIYRALDFFCSPHRVLWRRPDGTTHTLRWGPPVAFDGHPPVSYLPPADSPLLPDKPSQVTWRDLTPVDSTKMALNLVKAAPSRHSNGA